MSLNVHETRVYDGKKYGQKGTIFGPNSNIVSIYWSFYVPGDLKIEG
jgi:hypothetical protein